MVPRPLWPLVLVLAACGPGPDVKRARALFEVATSGPPYEGITRCGPPYVPPADAPDPHEPELPPLGPDPGFVPGNTPAAAAKPDAVYGSLDRDVIARPIRARFAAFRACYLRALEGDPELAGKVTARFHVTPDGTVAGVEIDGLDRTLDACLCDEIAALHYPAFGSARFGGVSVSYPFMFSAP
jgi:hypothetical protein